MITGDIPVQSKNNHVTWPDAMPRGGTTIAHSRKHACN